MIWDIEVGLVEEWIRSLDPVSLQRVNAALEILEQEGPSLGRPLVDSMKGSRQKNMKELRPGSVGATELRILFIFDPQHRAICSSQGTNEAYGLSGTGGTLQSPMIGMMRIYERQENEQMGKSFRELQAELPVDREAVEAIKREMWAEVRSYRLRELREQTAMTQVQLAEALDVSQNRISRIENGDIERTQVDTLRRYVEAFGGKLHIEVVMDDSSFTIA